MIGNASDIGSFEASVPPLPPTATVIVNNGSAQRSRVNVIQIVFSPNTTFPAGVNAALTVTRTGPAEPAGTVPTVAVLGGTSLTVLFSPSVMAPLPARSLTATTA